MNEALFFDTLRQAIWTSVIISAPLLGTALAVGLAIGLLQALTSVQEATLTFVPKVGAMLIVFWVSMTFMTSALISFLTGQIIPLIAGS
ncbi:MAG: flagellar biosynthetic protein FliQ [Paracoccaceae bacterium]